MQKRSFKKFDIIEKIPALLRVYLLKSNQLTLIFSMDNIRVIGTEALWR